MIARVKPYIAQNELIELLLQTSPPADPVTLFEDTFASRIGVKEAFALNSGRLALLTGLRALDIKPGDEIIVPSFICNAVIDPILQVGAVPVLVDSNLHDFNISVDSIARAISGRSKAILVAHLFGMPAEIAPIMQIASENACYLIEDCAHCMDVEAGGKHVGTFGDIGIFSLAIDKPITTGSGGILISSNLEISGKLKYLTQKLARTPLEEERRELFALLLQFWLLGKGNYSHFLSFEYGSDLLRLYPGLYKKMLSMLRESSFESIKKELARLQQAPLSFRVIRAIGRRLKPRNRLWETRFNLLRGKTGSVHLQGLQTVAESRNKNARWLGERINRLSHFRTAVMPANASEKLIRQTIFYDGRHSIAEIAARGRELGIEAGLFNWPSPIHHLKRYQNKTRFAKSDLVNCEKLAKQLFQLPIHPEVGEVECEAMLELLKAFDK
ncbi:MAG: DegT/DnrJ/EryC1/StrS family aminotransferase [Calditrichia bacterium]